MITAFKYGLKIGINHWRTALIGYVFQFLLALTLGMQVFQVFEASIGSSLEINKLVEGFNDTVVTDFIHVHGASLSPLLGQVRYLLLVYLVFSVFINAGLLFSVAEEKSGWNSFWEGGKKYFFRFLGLALFFLLLAGLWSIVTLIPYIGYMQPSIEDFSSEKITVYLFFVVLFIWLCGLFYLFNASVVARLKVMMDDNTVWQGIRAGIVFSFRRFFSLTGLFFLFLFLQLIFIAAYWMAEDATGMVSSTLIFLFFILQQLLVFSRWVFRLALYGGVKRMLA